ncbi:MAG TPA: alpha/beta hydrolase [Ktedonobacteraceae bacterium]|nr:alpha/beta hydrolase [Ktedonobacteraceae bacterium]
MTKLIIGGQTLDYTQYSDGDLPLIFIHGIASSQHSWLDFPLRFTDYGRAITLSLPGHYPARFPERMRRATLSDPWIGDILGEAIERITKGTPALLIGHSTGGYAALATAWRAPQLVKGVITLAGFARGVWGGALGLAQRLHILGAPGAELFNALLTGNARGAALVDLAWQHCFHDKAAFHACTAYQAARADIIADLTRMDARSLRLWFYQMRTVSNLKPYLSQITAPVLAIAGKCDRTVPPEQTLLIGHNVFYGTTILLDDLDHALYMEEPDKIERCMRDWINENMLR